MQPVTGFHVTSVHSILDVPAIFLTPKCVSVTLTQRSSYQRYLNMCTPIDHVMTFAVRGHQLASADFKDGNTLSICRPNTDNRCGDKHHFCVRPCLSGGLRFFVGRRCDGVEFLAGHWCDGVVLSTARRFNVLDRSVAKSGFASINSCLLASAIDAASGAAAAADCTALVAC